MRYAKEKFALRSTMAFNALTKFAPPELRTKLVGGPPGLFMSKIGWPYSATPNMHNFPYKAGPLRVAAFGGGPAAELFAAVDTWPHLLAQCASGIWS